ncbi:FtsK/SpoIIIE domain-containing protein [Streptomyces sp. NPDC002754]
MEFNLHDGPFTGMSGSAGVSEFPDVFTYEDARGFIWHSPECEYLMGINGRGEPEVFNLVDDSPHAFVSAAPGSGKSVIAASIATQALVKGASVAFLDMKRISHRWAKNLPDVTYAVEIDECANVIISVAAEVRRRMRIIDEFPGPVAEAPVGPRLVLLMEEANTLMGQLEEFEKTLPPRGVYRPRRALADILNLGRAAKVHVVAFAQYPDGRLFPKAMIEAFGHRVLIRHTNESWKSLAWQLGYARPSPQQRGRGLTVRGDKAIETQFLYMPEELCAQLVRDAYDARERMGLVPTRRERRQQARGAARELRRAEGRKVG